jgi:uncharacterized cupin superfamily protein
VEAVNVFRIACQYDDEDPQGYRPGYARLADRLGAVGLGGTVYELQAEQSICPYHYEYGNEEWLLVVAGRPTLRTPAGERELEPGDVICFPEGPEGAHKVTNRGEELVRVLMLSTKNKPDVSVYPDSDKIGVFPGNKDDTHLFVRDSAVDYFEGEL